MSSLIEGYNYDIFISYRQKDNKHDGWVTEFVDNLKGELESTFKEEISVYFDINPHDGLLETHDVYESLKEKLKCLIFIPIISRTYCDPKAFAWAHEFKAFVERASKDEYGLKVRLPSGNVANRVLPIVIYDLDKQDIKLCESVLGGVLRGVEFIYKEPGVNRPLRSNEEKPHENLNNTVYRNQVNKVANTIKDVLNSLAGRETSIDHSIAEPTIVDNTIATKNPLKKKSREIPSVSILYNHKNLAALSQGTWRIVVLALAFLLLVVGAYWLGQRNTTPPDSPVFRSDIPLTQNLGRTGRKSLAISPDGEYLVYVTNEGLNLIQLNSDAPSQPISGTANSRSPFFSPDGTWMAYDNFSERKIMKIPLIGGNPVTICDLESGMNQANWYENEIIFAVGTSIYQVSGTGGMPELLYPLVQSGNDPILWNPQLLPDKKTLLFSQQSGNGDWTIMTWRLGSNESPAMLVENGMDGRYLNSGHLVYSFNNYLYICDFNSRTNRIISESQIIATNPVWENTSMNYGPSQFDFSANGILVYYEQGSQSDQTNLIWLLEESGDVVPITNEAKQYNFFVISSDGQSIATSVLPNSESSNYQISTVDTKTGADQLFIQDASSPVWSTDNSSILYVSEVNKNQVFQKPLALNSPSTMLFEIDSANIIYIKNLSSDGRYLPFDADFGPGYGYDLGYYDMANNKVEMLEYYNSDVNDLRPAISPDGKWLAYQSLRDGQNAIYVSPFPGPGQPRRVTSSRPSNDIFYPIWSPDMTALYYLTINPDYELWKVNLNFSDKNFSPDPAQSIFIGGRNRFDYYDDLEIHPNGDRFLTQQIESGTEEYFEPRIKVIVNWEQELEGN